MGVYRRMLSAPHTSSNSRSRKERTRGSSVPAALGAGSARSGRERTPPGPTGYGPVLRGRNPASRSPQGDLTRPAFVPFGQPSVPLRTPVVSPLPASSSVLPQPHVAAFPNGGNELPQSSAAAFPNVQLSAQVQGLEQMMQQMVLVMRMKATSLLTWGPRGRECRWATSFLALARVYKKTLNPHNIQTLKP